ncbi:MAG TPA: twin-arginine translocase TatA/TatE family subunit [Deltaproteobacteria bacterium]|jgi:Sec-independent protein translocase protein TatA|nr:twin-arginine translocase TatA/TatE family subunit [Deltaproteobacteria bacterium]
MLFGAKRLPMIGEGLGSMITNFKKATKTNELEEKKEESVLVEGSSKEKEGVS